MVGRWDQRSSEPCKEMDFGCDSSKGLHSAVDREEVERIPEGRWDIPLSRW